ncbi:MAG: sigma-70 family RNA polymerase sigma factor [Alphaproteobacteria bacterium]|nr:MAG: sigma-70 family RNA polymerase sigma factor [Alphaproteobacteria bacterium]
MVLSKAPQPEEQPPRHEDLLVRVGKHQDRDAFIALFTYFAPRIKSYMLKHGAAEAAAEEVIQNTFVTVWEKAGSYDPKKAAASTWIFTIARNKRIDALRREKFVEVNSDSLELEKATYEAEEVYADKEDVDRLNSALAGLPPDQAELLRMSFFEDKSHQKIAEEKHLPLGTVKSRLRAALEKLRGVMTPAGEKKP